MAVFLRVSILLLFVATSSVLAQQTISCSTCDATLVRQEVLAKGTIAPSLIRFSCPLSIAHLSPVSKWGIADEKGNILIAATWDSIGTIHDVLVEVYQYIPQRKKAAFKAGLISLKGQVVLPLNFRAVRHLTSSYFTVHTGKGVRLWHSHRGFLSALTYDSITVVDDNILLYTDGFTQYVHPFSGKIIAEPLKQWRPNQTNLVYDTLYLYHNGLLTTVLADSIGSSSRADEVLMYRNQAIVAQRFPESYAALSLQGESTPHPVPLSTLLDSTLIKIKFRTGADSIVLLDSWFLYQRKGLWGYGDTLGNVPIGAQYETLGYKYNNRIAMKLRGKWGFLDERENFILQPYYEEVGDFRFKGAWIRQGKKYNFIDLQGKVLNSNWYDNITPTIGHNYVVHFKGKAGLVSKEGREIIGTRYLQVLDFGEGSCLTQTEDQKWFLMNYGEYRISNHPYSSVKYLPTSKTYVLKK